MHKPKPITFTIPKTITLGDLGIANAEEQLLAVHHALALMPGDPGPSLPMVVRLGAVIARLEEDGGKGGGVVAATAPTNPVVDYKSTTTPPKSTELLTNLSGLILIELDVFSVGTVYVAKKTPFASPDEAAAFLRLHPHEDFLKHEDLTPQNMYVVAVDEEHLLLSRDVLAAFRAAQSDCVIGAW